MRVSLFNPLIASNGVLILDGAMATELEKKGADLKHSLWSARVLMENPNLIKQVHIAYLEAGADIITSASYQASFAGFSQHGLNELTAIYLMQLSIALACEARNLFCAKASKGAFRPLIGASIGPYGASLADGSEYRGYPGITVEHLIRFHEKRMGIFVDSEADFLACETIPSIEEAEALVAVLKLYPTAKAWISFSCKNGQHLCSGQLFAEAVAIAAASEQVEAIGVNCTSPEYISSLIAIAKNGTDKPIVVYPNKGETWDATDKCWVKLEGQSLFASKTKEWYDAGARIIGGCCQTSPADIKQMSLDLKQRSNGK